MPKSVWTAAAGSTSAQRRRAALTELAGPISGVAGGQASEARTRGNGDLEDPDPGPGLRVDGHRFNGGWPQRGLVDGGKKGTSCRCVAPKLTGGRGGSEWGPLRHSDFPAKKGSGPNQLIAPTNEGGRWASRKGAGREVLARR